MSAKSLLITCLAILSFSSIADSLEDQILALDKKLFEAFNKRDIETFKSFLSPKLEFYHDKAGKTGFEQSVNSLKDLAKNGLDLNRKLVPESSEIYPVPGYGAMQLGQHEFCHTDGGKIDCGTFKFLHIWRNQDGKWQITRVASYDH